MDFSMPRFLLALLLLLVASPALATEAGWALLREGGHVVLIRHAMAPGTGDPANFDLERCATQRNLSDQGRQQARRMGALFAARAAPVERVLSSRWCRCLETARLAFGDDAVEPFEALDSFFGDDSTAEAQTAAVLETIRDYTGSGNLVMVTHQVNITALTGIVPRPGEAVIVAPDGDGVRVTARIIFR
jgi:phosphohistidine phosphatase SixA